MGLIAIPGILQLQQTMLTLHEEAIHEAAVRNPKTIFKLCSVSQNTPVQMYFFNVRFLDRSKQNRI